MATAVASSLSSEEEGCSGALPTPACHSHSDCSAGISEGSLTSESHSTGSAVAPDSEAQSGAVGSRHRVKMSLNIGRTLSSSGSPSSSTSLAVPRWNIE